VTFVPGHHPQHDLAKAGSKAAKKSPWRKGFSPNSQQTFVKLKRHAKKQS
jgi:hypothetical protein